MLGICDKHDHCKIKDHLKNKCVSSSLFETTNVEGIWPCFQAYKDFKLISVDPVDNSSYDKWCQAYFQCKIF